MTITGYVDTEEELTGVHRGMRRLAESSLANRARNVRTVAARTRRRAADDHHRSRAPLGCAVAGSADVDESRRDPGSAGSGIRRVAAPICVAIDILDEDHSLRLAMRPAWRPMLSCACRSARPGGGIGQREHSMPRMLEDYERILTEAASRPAPRVRCRRT